MAVEFPKQTRETNSLINKTLGHLADQDAAEMFIVHSFETYSGSLDEHGLVLDCLSSYPYTSEHSRGKIRIGDLDNIRMNDRHMFPRLLSGGFRSTRASVLAFFGGEKTKSPVDNFDQISGGFVAQFSSERVRHEGFYSEYRTRYERIDFFHYGHVGYDAAFSGRSNEIQGPYGLALYEVRDLNTPDISEDFREVRSQYSRGRGLGESPVIRGLPFAYRASTPLFDVRTYLDDGNYEQLRNLYDVLCARVEAAEQKIKDQTVAENNKRINESNRISDEIRKAGTQKAVDFFNQPTTS